MHEMDKLNLPEFNFRISHNTKNKPVIFDVFRKKYVNLTPEEWVRQHIIHYLVTEKNVPESLISIESGLSINKLIKRYDALIYDRFAHPWMLVECKAPKVPINQSVFDQAIVYNQKIKAKYILVTNGLKHYCCMMNDKPGKAAFLSEIPFFKDTN